MHLGWIDFSDKDRRKALDIIHLLEGQGAVDELGIGTLRDAFANFFFPGSSTVQTRAKYFFIVPYAIKDCCENKRYHNVHEVRKALDEMERSCALEMSKEGKDRSGVIGADILPQRWVVRKPSSIYWNGIRKMGILTNAFLSIDECILESLSRRETSSGSNWMADGEENEQDDKDAGHDAVNPLWNLPPHVNWRNDLRVELTRREASMLRSFISSLHGSLYKYIIDENINLQEYSATEVPFRALYEDIKDAVPDNIGRMMQMAVRVDSLIYLCRVLYNKILSQEKSARANQKWDNWYNEQHVEEIRNLNLDEVFTNLNISDRGRIKTFLERMQGYFVIGDTESASKEIREREIYLKGEKRAKLLRRNDFDKDSWIGGEHLDYRLSSAAQILNDIYVREGRDDV